MSLTETAMLVKPRVSMWSARKMDNRVNTSIASEHECASNVGNFYKKLIKSDALDAFKRVAGEFRNYNYMVTMPWEDGGTRLLPATMYYDYREMVASFIEKADQHASEFTVMYAEHKKDAQTFLGKLYREADYPDPSEMRAKFGLGYHITPIPTIGDWRIESLQDERDQIERDLEALYERKLGEAYADLWSRLYEATDKIYERLVDPGNIFKKDLIANVASLCDLLQKLNIDNDPNLAKMATDVKLKLCSTNVDVLRANATVRYDVAQQAKTIMDAMAPYMGSA